MQLSAIKVLIQDSLDDVEALLDQQLDSPVELIKNISTHLVHAGGKRIRPILLILVSRAYGVEGKSDVVLGAAMELIHAATLLHDDVVDNSQMRRGLKTANAIWDNAASVLVGDFLYSRAFQLMVQAQDSEVFKMLSEATNIIATGEVLQLQNRHNADLREQDYLDVLRYKTGALFAAATQVGAILALRPKEDIALMAEFGENLGVAFQLSDDALDLTADEKILGKNLGDDLADGKLTLPLLHALSKVSADQKAIIVHAIETGERTALAEIVDIVKSAGGFEYTAKLAKTYALRARQSLNALPDTPYKEALMGLTNLLVDRET